MSSLLIVIIADITRPARAASLSRTLASKMRGVICLGRPYLSLSQPHRLGDPPAQSLSFSASTSDCVWQLTISEIASVNLNYGPPLSAAKG